MKKRIISFFLCVVLIVSCFANAASNYTVYGDEQQRTNIALNKLADATSYGGDNYPSKAVDGSIEDGHAWGSEEHASQESHFTVNLMGRYEVDGVNIIFDPGAYPVHFELQYSTDNKNWFTIKEFKDNDQSKVEYDFTAVTARYLRIQAFSTTNNDWAFSIYEMEAYGTSLSNYTNLALGQSIEGTTVNGGDKADNAVDGLLHTRWGSTEGAPADSALTVSLADISSVGEVEMYFENAYPTDFTIQSSENGVIWNDEKVISGNSEKHHLIVFDQAFKAKFVRIQAKEVSVANWGFSVFELLVYGKEGFEEEKQADKIGNVLVNGDPDFDSDSVANPDEGSWLWNSYPKSRLVLNPGTGNTAFQRVDYDKGLNLRLGVFANGIHAVGAVHKILVGDTAATAGDCTSYNTTWYPYRIAIDADYGGSNVHVDEFFANKDTFVRYMDFSDAKDKGIRMEAQVDGIKKLDNNSLLVEKADYYFVYEFLELNEDSSIKGRLNPTVSGNKWTVSYDVTQPNQKLAFTVTIAAKNVDDDGDGTNNNEQTVIDRALQTVVNKKISDLLADTKAMWDANLKKVPAPQSWGIQDVDTKGVTPQQHRRAFYAGWTYQYQNILEPTLETGYEYYQVTLGKASLWPNGHKDFPNSCAWESLYNIQEIALVEPEIAWNAAEGFIQKIDDTGYLDGECLPSQKAHVVWVCHQNKPDNEKLKELYPKLKLYLQWRFENPRWIHYEGNYGHDYKDEKDISFITQWYSDVDYVIQICKEIGEIEDIAHWEDLKEQMYENIREWFFEDDRIYMYMFTDSGAHYNEGRPYRPEDEPNYIFPAMTINELPEDLMTRLINVVADFIDESKPLAGFGFSKYGDACYTAYGLLNKAQEYEQLEGKDKIYINSLLREIVINKDFSEAIRVQSDGTTMIEGVEPSTFGVNTVIDFTYLNNGIRIDSGIPYAIDLEESEIESVSDIDLYTIKGRKATFPDQVQVKGKNSTTFPVAVHWEKVDDERYTTESSFEVTGKIANTSKEVTATVHVYKGEVTVSSVTQNTIQGEIPSLPGYVGVKYSQDGSWHDAPASVLWDEITKEQVSEAGAFQITGYIGFNNQEIKATVNVSKKPVIETDSGKDEINQYELLKLVSKDGDNQSLETKWSIKDAAYNKAAYIKEDGTFIGLKPGKVTVLAEIAGYDVAIEKEITVLSVNAPSFAHGGNATASDWIDEKRNPASAIDEDEKTMWRSSKLSGNQWFQLELENEIPVYGLNVIWHEGNQPSKYVIKGSADGVNWSEIKTITSPSTGDSDYAETLILDTAQSIKYVRIEMQGKSKNEPGIMELQVFGNPEITTPLTQIDVTSEKDVVSIKGEMLQMHANAAPAAATDKRVSWSVENLDGSETEIAEITSSGILKPVKNGSVKVIAKSVDGSKVFGEKTIVLENQDLENIALGKSASATTNGGSGTTPDLAVDGDMNTRWGSAENASQSSHFTVDLGKQYEIYSTALAFDVGAYPIDYKLQISNDGSLWEDVGEIQGNSDVTATIALEKPIAARYVRILSSQTSNKQWGYSIWEFEVYGKEVKTAGEVAKDITQVTAPKAGDEKLQFPQVPEGYEISIKSATPQGVVGKDGTITPPETNVNVKIVFTVTKDGNSADTQEITVVVPGIGSSQAKKDLKSLMNQAAGLKESGYTKNSWAVFKIIYNTVNELYSGKDLSESECISLKAKLQTAINGLVKIVVPKPVVKNGWVKKVTYTYYYKNNKLVKSSWIKSGKKTYRTDSKGRKVTSKWVTVGKYKYYLKKDGNLAKSTWVTYKKNKYRVDSKGRMLKSKWTTVSKKKYYLKKDGKMAVSAWVKYKNKKYRVDKKGIMLKSKWVKVKGKSYYLNKKGYVTKTK